MYNFFLSSGPFTFQWSIESLFVSNGSDRLDDSGNNAGTSVQAADASLSSCEYLIRRSVLRPGNFAVVIIITNAVSAATRLFTVSAVLPNSGKPDRVYLFLFFFSFWFVTCIESLSPYIGWSVVNLKLGELGLFYKLVQHWKIRTCTHQWFRSTFTAAYYV